ncbi:hypothetical protein [Alkaliphilus sp. B6464]|uniref:hypothetical protein n=1 Tax=Alkaliphilus sp. B6464 TaxID=2731219 RepID=UPI001BA7E453|nr:hypothetical protein [Alkaliphilus sp. B6464]QUH22089.1 hypothetical protein HYG84_19475 [Alkaliphilus sp. B6464]
MSTKIFKPIVLFAIMLLFLMPIFSLNVLANESSDVPYIVDNLKLIDQYNTDRIYTLGKELSDNGIHIMLHTSKTAVDYSKKTRDLYFEWLGKLNNQEKLLTLVYFQDTGNIIYYQDANNLINNATIETINANLKGYNEHDDINGGLYYAYSAVTDKIAKDNKLNTNLIHAETKPKYKVSSLKSMPVIFATMIVTLIAYCIIENKIAKNNK